MSRNQREGRYYGKRAGRHLRTGGKGLPDGLRARNGVLLYDCPGCERESEWNGTVEDFEHPDSVKLCGGTQWCCP